MRACPGQAWFPIAGGCRQHVFVLPACLSRSHRVRMAFLSRSRRTVPVPAGGRGPAPRGCWSNSARSRRPSGCRDVEHELLINCAQGRLVGGECARGSVGSSGLVGSALVLVPARDLHQQRRQRHRQREHRRLVVRSAAPAAGREQSPGCPSKVCRERPERDPTTTRDPPRPLRQLGRLNPSVRHTHPPCDRHQHVAHTARYARRILRRPATTVAVKSQVRASNRPPRRNPRRAPPHPCPPLPPAPLQRRQRQICRQPAPAVEHPLPRRLSIAGTSDGVAEGIPRRTTTHLHLVARRAQHQNEAVHIVRGDRRPTHRPAQLHPRRQRALTRRLLQLRPRRRPRRRPIRRSGHRQPVTALDLPRRHPQPRVVMARPDPPTVVLANQHHRDVDVVIGMSHRHPPRPTPIAGLGDPRTMQQLPRDPRPLPVTQGSVGGRDAGRAMPHIPTPARTRPRRRQPRRNGRRLQRGDQRPENQTPGRATDGLPRRVPTIPSGDHPRVRVLLRPARTQQIPDQPTGCHPCTTFVITTAGPDWTPPESTGQSAAADPPTPPLPVCSTEQVPAEAAAAAPTPPATPREHSGILGGRRTHRDPTHPGCDRTTGRGRGRRHEPVLLVGQPDVQITPPRHRRMTPPTTTGTYGSTHDTTVMTRVLTASSAACASTSPTTTAVRPRTAVYGEGRLLLYLALQN